MMQDLVQLIAEVHNDHLNKNKHVLACIRRNE